MFLQFLRPLPLSHHHSSLTICLGDYNNNVEQISMQNAKMVVGGDLCMGGGHYRKSPISKIIFKLAAFRISMRERERE